MVAIPACSNGLSLNPEGWPVLFQFYGKVYVFWLCSNPFPCNLAQRELGTEGATRIPAFRSFPNPLTDAASVQRYFPWFLVWQEVQQADDLNEVRFSAAIGADQD